MVLDVYENIDLYGLTETADDLSLPNDERGRTGGVRGAGGWIVPDRAAWRSGAAGAWACEAVSSSQAGDVDNTDAGDGCDRGPIRAADGSEVLEAQIEKTQRQVDRARDLLGGLEMMADAAARCYEIETGRAYMPPSGGRTGRMA